MTGMIKPLSRGKTVITKKVLLIFLINLLMVKMGISAIRMEEEQEWAEKFFLHWMLIL